MQKTVLAVVHISVFYYFIFLLCFSLYRFRMLVQTIINKGIIVYISNRKYSSQTAVNKVMRLKHQLP